MPPHHSEITKNQNLLLQMKKKAKSGAYSHFRNLGHSWQETINDDANGGKANEECPLIILKLGRSLILFWYIRALMAGDNQ